MDYLFATPTIQTVPVKGETALYPVNRVFCVGRNYVAHATEMGGEVDREAPWYFTKSAQAVCMSGETVPYPPGTSNFHHEMELAIALGGPAFKADLEEAQAAIYGYGSALDMTRRDRQQDGKDNRRPWSLGKDVENSAVLAEFTRVADAGNLAEKRIHLSVNGEIRQDATLAEMVWSVAEIVSHLSAYYHLQAGDVILTGTPAGVGPVVAGDKITGGIDGFAPISLNLSAAE
jgi:fumarylpyruvate hydrolase